MGLIWPKLVGPSSSYTPIEFVGGNTFGGEGIVSATTDMTLTSGLTGGIASAVSNDDLVIAAYARATTSNNTMEITGGSGYTTIGSELYSDDSNDTDFLVAYKFVSGDTSVTFGRSYGLNFARATAVYVFRNVDQTTPLDVTAVTATAANSVLADPPAITPSSPGAYIVCVGAGAHSAGTQTFTSSDLTDFQTVGFNDGNDITLGIGHKPDWTSGEFNPAAFGFSTSDTTTYSWAALTFALRPAS